MEIDLFVTLKRKVTQSLLNRLEPVRVSELCWYIRPYVALHRIDVTDSALVFPEIRRLVLSLTETIPKLADYPSPRNTILFDDVVGFSEKSGNLEIFLKSGFVYILSACSNDRKIINLFPEKMYPNAGKLRLFWWNCLGNLELFGWKMKEYFRRTVL